MRRGNSSMTPTQLALALFAVATLAVLVIWAAVFLPNMGNEAKEEECRSSIVLHSQFVKTTSGDANPEIACEPQLITVENKDPERIKQIMADQMVFCWDRWQQGEVQLFTGEGSYCNPCSIIEFEKKGQNVPGLMDYLHTTEMKNGATYEAYLFPDKTMGYNKTAKQRPEITIDTDKTYAVVFYHDKNHSMKKYAEIRKEDPARAKQIIDDALMPVSVGAGVGGAVGGGLAAAAITCTAITMGICGVVIGAATIVGAVVVGGATLAWVGANGAEYPEWYSMVVFIEHNSTAYKALGCSNVSQQGVPTTTGGAENI